MSAEGMWALSRVVRATGLTPRTITAHVKAGTFPEPAMTTANGTKLWDAMAVEEYATEHKKVGR